MRVWCVSLAAKALPLLRWSYLDYRSNKWVLSHFWLKNLRFYRVPTRSWACKTEYVKPYQYSQQLLHLFVYSKNVTHYFSLTFFENCWIFGDFCDEHVQRLVHWLAYQHLILCRGGRSTYALCWFSLICWQLSSGSSRNLFNCRV